MHAQHPRSILALGPQTCAGFTHYCQQHPQTQLDCLEQIDDLQDIKALGVHELAFISGCLEHMDKTRAGQLIAMLRDVYSKRLYLLLPGEATQTQQSTHWAHSELIALGLSLVDNDQPNSTQLRLYRFDIVNYKQTPDWLNPKYWANPQRWEKARW